jgi:hypothetical protein
MAAAMTLVIIGGGFDSLGRPHCRYYHVVGML